MKCFIQKVTVCVCAVLSGVNCELPAITNGSVPTIKIEDGPKIQILNGSKSAKEVLLEWTGLNGTAVQKAAALRRWQVAASVVQLRTNIDVMKRLLVIEGYMEVMGLVDKNPYAQDRRIRLWGLMGGSTDEVFRNLYWPGCDQGKGRMDLTMDGHGVPDAAFLGVNQGSMYFHLYERLGLTLGTQEMQSMALEKKEMNSLQIHKSWLDRLPIASLEDKVVNQIGAIKLEELMSRNVVKLEKNLEVVGNHKSGIQQEVALHKIAFASVIELVQDMYSESFDMAQSKLRRHFPAPLFKELCKLATSYDENNNKHVPISFQEIDASIKMMQVTSMVAMKEKLEDPKTEKAIDLQLQEVSVLLRKQNATTALKLDQKVIDEIREHQKILFDVTDGLLTHKLTGVLERKIFYYPNDQQYKMTLIQVMGEHVVPIYESRQRLEAEKLEFEEKIATPLKPENPTKVYTPPMDTPVFDGGITKEHKNDVVVNGLPPVEKTATGAPVKDNLPKGVPVVEAAPKQVEEELIKAVQPEKNEMKLMSKEAKALQLLVNKDPMAPRAAKTESFLHHYCCCIVVICVLLFVAIFSVVLYFLNNRKTEKDAEKIRIQRNAATYGSNPDYEWNEKVSVYDVESSNPTVLSDEIVDNYQWDGESGAEIFKNRSGDRFDFSFE